MSKDIPTADIIAWCDERNYAIVAREAFPFLYMDIVRCGECKHLEVVNKAPIYAHCHKWNYDFKLWQEDTMTNFCSWGEKSNRK